MLTETTVSELIEETLSHKDKDELLSLLATKTEHLLVASRCHLPDHTLQTFRKEVQMIQVEIKKREENQHISCPNALIGK